MSSFTKNNDKNLPIGVFDSGIGGLTVLDKLIEMFPHEDFVYVGDTINLPYGVKSKEELKKIVSRVSHYLNDLPVKAIVIACNTATANSHHLASEIDIPVIGVIEPTAKRALEISNNILVCATNVTIDSNEYQDIINNGVTDKSAHQHYLKCSDFVDAIESNIINTKESFELVENKFRDIKDENVGVIVCGCTHFGLYEKEFKNIFPNAEILECAIPTGNRLRSELEKRNLLQDDEKKIGKVTISLTKAQDNFYEKTKWFKHPYDGVNIIKI